ncbi:MAG: M24 family metallopeptidase, partial [bacterium]|nr:M24 family metallopeptidase [bacterium]MDW8164018.1 M24 family metallopeptidase [Candidatus Omnitrophota bacterium]
NFDEEIKKIIPGKVVADTNLNIEDLHFPLLPEEIERFKKLGKETAISIRELAEEIKVGNREIEVAGRLCEKLWGKNIIPITILIASDERIKKFRHPIPKDKKIKKYVMLVVCARREGLIVSLTRFVHFGKINNELRKKHIAVCRIDAHFINSTRVGETIGNVFCKGIEMYEKTGYKEEWKKHHQGGLTGYLTRYFRATEKSSKIIIENMAFAWNPSITGTKSEDTIITTKEKPIIITEDKNWPMLKININDMEILRPDIMIK